MKRIFALALLALAAAAPAQAQDVLGENVIRGAGSTFAFPIVSRWAHDYERWQAAGGAFPVANSGLETPPPGAPLDYEPVGSLAGTLRASQRAVDFGTSDVPLDAAALKRLNLIQFPLVIGGVVAVVNIDGVGPGQIKFNGPLLADIFLGKVDNWGHPSIKALNPDLKLPDAKIVVVHRSDGSGTTFNFTDYLSRQSADWKGKVGSDLLVKWPVGIGTKGNDGIAQTVRQALNSIGYVEFATAQQARLSYGSIANRAGKFIAPDRKSFQAAAASADWGSAADFALMLNDAPGEEAYPMVATVFVLMNRSIPRRRAQAAYAFFDYAFDRGSDQAAALGYVPLPAALVGQIKRYWAKAY